jgi:glycosyltransferase involved in cell wall biosynthesis
MVGERSDVAELLPHAEMLWNGSLYEGQSNVILEAMQSGVPVVASDIPGNTDLIQHRSTGMLYPLGDVERLSRDALDLFNDPDLRAKLVRNAQEFVRVNHSLESMIRRHAELYQGWIRSLR